MTLILTALCKDGICICADKRSKRQYDNGRIEYKDDLNKIYQFRNGEVAICNHGVNEMQNKSWETFCSDYEASNRWVGKNLFQIIDDLRSFIESNIQQQREDNFRHNRSDSTTIGFIICGKTSLDSKFKINELFWSFDSGGLHFESKRHYGLVRTGVGNKYLEKYINDNSSINTIDFWKRMSTRKAEKELNKLFAAAVVEKKRLTEEEISDENHIVSIS